MSRALAILALLGASVPVAAGAASRKPKKSGAAETRDAIVPLYDAKTGEREALLRAATLKRDPKNEHLLQVTDVRIQVYQRDKVHTARGDRGTISIRKRTATLRGSVLLVFDDAPKEADKTRVKSDDLYWDGGRDTATIESRVTILRQGMTIYGVGCEVELRYGPKPAEGEPDRRGKVVVGGPAKSIIQPGRGGLLFERPVSRKPGGSGTPGPRPGQSTPSRPITITCHKSLTIFRPTTKAIYDENVRAVQGRKSITCDRMTVLFRPSDEDSKKAVVDTILAHGNVRIDDGSSMGLARRAVWSRPQGSMELRGRPAEVRWDNGNRICAGLILRLQNGDLFYCSRTPEHPGYVRLLVYAAGGQSHQPTPPAPGEKPSPRTSAAPARSRASAAR